MPTIRLFISILWVGCALTALMSPNLIFASNQPVYNPFNPDTGLMTFQYVLGLQNVTPPKQQSESDFFTYRIQLPEISNAQSSTNQPIQRLLTLDLSKAMPAYYKLITDSGIQPERHFIQYLSISLPMEIKSVELRIAKILPDYATATLTQTELARSEDQYKEHLMQQKQIANQLKSKELKLKETLKNLQLTQDEYTDYMTTVEQLQRNSYRCPELQSITMLQKIANRKRSLDEYKTFSAKKLLNRAVLLCGYESGRNEFFEGSDRLFFHKPNQVFVEGKFYIKSEAGTWTLKDKMSLYFFKVAPDVFMYFDRSGSVGFGAVQWDGKTDDAKSKSYDEDAIDEEWRNREQEDR